MSEPHSSTRRVVAEIVRQRYGKVEEELMASGLVDSLGAVDLALLVAKTFTLDPRQLRLTDLKTLGSLSARIDALGGSPNEG